MITMMRGKPRYPREGTKTTMATKEYTVTVICPTCCVCHKQAKIKVSRHGYRQWKAGQLIQTAFPELSDSQREMIKTGTHPACWTELWAGVEADDEDEDDD